VRSGRADGIAGGRAEPALDGPLLDLRRSRALLDLGDLAAGNASEPLIAGAMAIWFTPEHGAVVDLAPAELRALPAPRPVPVRMLPPERPFGPLIAQALEEVRERLAQHHVVHVVGADGPVAGLLSALARQDADPSESALCVDARGAVLPDILQVLFELLCVATPASIAAADELRAGLRDVSALVLVRDSALTVSEADTLGDTLRGCRIVLADERERSSDDAPVRLGSSSEEAPEAVARRVGSLGKAEVQALEVLLAVDGDPLHERVLGMVVPDGGGEALRGLHELALAEADGPWHRAAAAVGGSMPEELRPERWAGPLAWAIAEWGDGARRAGGGPPRPRLAVAGRIERRPSVRSAPPGGRGACPAVGSLARHVARRRGARRGQGGHGGPGVGAAPVGQPGALPGGPDRRAGVPRGGEGPPLAHRRSRGRRRDAAQPGARDDE
jgi:hypothetical protein